MAPPISRFLDELEARIGAATTDANANATATASADTTSAQELPPPQAPAASSSTLTEAQLATVAVGDILEKWATLFRLYGEYAIAHAGEREHTPSQPQHSTAQSRTTARPHPIRIKCLWLIGALTCCGVAVHTVSHEAIVLPALKQLFSDLAADSRARGQVRRGMPIVVPRPARLSRQHSSL